MSNKKKPTKKVIKNQEQQPKKEIVEGEISDEEKEEEIEVDGDGYNEDSVKDEDDEVEDEEDEEEKGKEDVDEGDGEPEGEGDEKEEKDNCIYNYGDDEDDENEQEIVFDDDQIEIDSEILPQDKRKTKPILFKYERVRLLGDRTQQLTLGAKPMIKNVEGLSAKEIAKLEIEQNVIPLIIQRTLPNGKKERWYIHELYH